MEAGFTGASLTSHHLSFIFNLTTAEKLQASTLNTMIAIVWPPKSQYQFPR